jgi:hypothetical protein
MSADDSVPADTIATLRIDLLDSEPPIWREIEIPVAMTLKQLMRSSRPPWDGRRPLCGGLPNDSPASLTAAA